MSNGSLRSSSNCQKNSPLDEHQITSSIDLHIEIEQSLQKIRLSADNDNDDRNDENLHNNNLLNAEKI